MRRATLLERLQPFPYTVASMLASWRPALVALDLVLLAAIAWFGARTVNAVVAAGLESPPDRPPAVSALAPAAPAAQPLSAYAVIHERDVFNPGTVAAPAASTAGAPRTDLNVKLWGTAVAADPRRSYAVIEDQVERRQRLYRVGDTILDEATLTRVEWDRVVLSRDGQEEILELSWARAAPGSGAPAAAAAAASGERIRRTADGKFLVDRRELEKTVENLNEVFTQARAVPYFQNGQTVGFRVFAIKPGSVFEKIGLKNGDVIRRVNGVELTDPTKAITLFNELQNQGHIAVDLDRNKQSQSFSYEIR